MVGEDRFGGSIALLRSSVDEWNRWRAEHPDIRVNLSAERLARADLSGADLRGADLTGADLTRAVLDRATLVRAFLLGANLSGASLRLTDLRDADLRGANVRGADLATALFLTQSQLETAKGNKQTRIPPALRRPEHWI